MKKLSLTLALLIAMSGISFAGTDKTVTGTITNIVIGQVWELTVASMLYLPVSGANDTYLGDLADGALAFEDATHFVDMSSDGIYAGDSDGNSTGTYADTPHRAGPLYTALQFWVNNNEEDTWKVTGRITGTLIALTSPLAGESVMHINLDRMTDEGIYDIDTIVTDNIQNEDQMQSLSTVALDLYIDDSSGTIAGDQFWGRVFLDFLPVDLPMNTYGGTAVWVLTASI